MRTLIIDSTNLFIINHSVNPSLDLNGNLVGGFVGTIKSFQNIVKALNPTKILAIWDGARGAINKRTIFREYKAGRKPVIGQHYAFDEEKTAKENMRDQIAMTKQMLSLLPLQQILVDDCEADDVMGYLVQHRAYFNVEPAIIVSTDKDFYQLAQKGVGIYNPVTKKVITEQTILADFNIHPKNWLFAKSICGDTSDNIDGIKGVGFKTAAKLFDLKNPDILFTHENITEDLKIKDNKKKLLLENKELVKRNEKLMSLKDPILSLNQKEKIDYFLNNFVPTLKTKQIYMLIMDLGLQINPMFISDFQYLAK